MSDNVAFVLMFGAYVGAAVIGWRIGGWLFDRWHR